MTAEGELVCEGLSSGMYRVINASEYDSSLRRPHKLPGAQLRSQKPGPRSPKHISTAVP